MLIFLPLQIYLIEEQGAVREPPSVISNVAFHHHTKSRKLYSHKLIFNAIFFIKEKNIKKKKKKEAVGEQTMSNYHI